MDPFSDFTAFSPHDTARTTSNPTPNNLVELNKSTNAKQSTKPKLHLTLQLPTIENGGIRQDSTDVSVSQLSQLVSQTQRDQSSDTSCSQILFNDTQDESIPIISDITKTTISDFKATKDNTNTSPKIVKSTKISLLTTIDKERVQRNSSNSNCDEINDRKIDKLSSCNDRSTIEKERWNMELNDINIILNTKDESNISILPETSIVVYSLEETQLSPTCYETSKDKLVVENDMVRETHLENQLLDKNNRTDTLSLQSEDITQTQMLHKGSLPANLSLQNEHEAPAQNFQKENRTDTLSLQSEDLTQTQVLHKDNLTGPQSLQSEYEASAQNFQKDSRTETQSLHKINSVKAIEPDTDTDLGDTEEDEPSTMTSDLVELDKASQTHAKKHNYTLNEEDNSSATASQFNSAQIDALNKHDYCDLSNTLQHKDHMAENSGSNIAEVFQCQCNQIICQCDRMNATMHKRTLLKLHRESRIEDYAEQLNMASQSSNLSVPTSVSQGDELDLENRSSPVAISKCTPNKETKIQTTPATNERRKRITRNEPFSAEELPLKNTIKGNRHNVKHKRGSVAGAKDVSSIKNSNLVSQNGKKRQHNLVSPMKVPELFSPPSKSKRAKKSQPLDSILRAPLDRTFHISRRNDSITSRLFSPPIIFVLSGFTDKALENMKALIVDHGGIMSDDERSVFIPGNPKYAVVIATPANWRKRKCRFAVACGIPVLHPEWLNACFKACSIVDFNGFYIPSGYCLSTRKSECLTQAPAPVFSNLRFGIPMDVAESKEDEVKRQSELTKFLLKCCGARRVVEDLQLPSRRSEHITIDVVLSDEYSEICEAYKKKYGIPVKRFAFVTECILLQRLIDPLADDELSTKPGNSLNQGAQTLLSADVVVGGDGETKMKLYPGELLLIDLKSSVVDNFALYQVGEIIAIKKVSENMKQLPSSKLQSYRSPRKLNRTLEDKSGNGNNIQLQVGILERDKVNPHAILCRQYIDVLEILPSHIKRRVVGISKSDFEQLKYRDEHILYYEQNN